MSQLTDRLMLPLLATAQAQKEITHNEALTLVDLLLAPAVEAVAPASIPANPAPGQGWIVGASPGGAWAEQADRLAFWTGGGWRFVDAPQGMTLWSIADAQPVQRVAGGWSVGVLRGSSLAIAGNQVVGPRLAAIAGASGGTTIDAEARTAIDSIIARLRSHGLIAA